MLTAFINSTDERAVWCVNVVAEEDEMSEEQKMMMSVMGFSCFESSKVCIFSQIIFVDTVATI